MNTRLRQHNGLIIGGAKYTRVGRPYELVCFISGFETDKSARSFEWHLHNPAASTLLSRFYATLKAPEKIGVLGRMRPLLHLIDRPGWRDMSLKLRYSNMDYSNQMAELPPAACTVAVMDA